MCVTAHLNSECQLPLSQSVRHFFHSAFLAGVTLANGCYLKIVQRTEGKLTVIFLDVNIDTSIFDAGSSFVWKRVTLRSRCCSSESRKSYENDVCVLHFDRI